MAALTKEQIRKLPAEQQEALAAAEIGRVRSRQELLKEAGRGMSAWAGLWIGLTSALAGVSTVFPRALPFAILAVGGLVTYHTTRIYRRLDAMMELIERENRRDVESSPDGSREPSN